MQDLKPLLRYYLSNFWQHRWNILLVTWVTCLVGWLVVALLPYQYRAKAEIYVDTESILEPLMQGLAVSTDIDRQGAGHASDATDTGSNLEELIRLARSRF